MKSPSKKTLRTKADRLLQEYIKSKNKLCVICESPVFCGHHFITRANSLALRYYIPNIIPICKHCHCLVHTQPHLIEPKIVLLMGSEWYDDLIEVKKSGIKETKDWYLIQIDELQSKISGINNK